LESYCYPQQRCHYHQDDLTRQQENEELGNFSYNKYISPLTIDHIIVFLSKHMIVYEKDKKKQQLNQLYYE
jgi:hypothetical protein